MKPLRPSVVGPVAAPTRAEYADPEAEAPSEEEDCDAQLVANQRESWMRLEAPERAMWEIIRPMHVLREKAMLRVHKLPTAAVARLMRLHPGLTCGKSQEVVDIIGHSASLLLGAVARAATKARRSAGGSAGASVRFEDVRCVCASLRELRFLEPLEYSLDPSARELRSGAGAWAAFATHTSESEPPVRLDAAPSVSNIAALRPLPTSAGKKRPPAQKASAGGAKRAKTSKAKTIAMAEPPQGIKDFFHRAGGA